MKARVFRISLLIAAFSIAAPISLQAAPSLPITEPPVTSSFMDGPPVDPWSIYGQWFLDSDGTEEYRPYEFHDNIIDHGGGKAENLAIEGVVVNILYLAGLGTPIIGFDVLATIYNDTPTAEGQESDASNSHSELRLAGAQRYVGTLFDTKLTAEFSIADIHTLPGKFSDPYRRPDFPSDIIADNEDQHAWYCWNESDPPDDQEAGNYYVPTWDFGDIPVDQSATRTLNFSVDPPMETFDPRYPVIIDSLELGNDVFANRTTSLKISTWIDNLAIDPGTDYPDEALRSSDVSVFHNIEEEDPHKMHYPQYPDPNGWDVRACYDPDDELQKVLADDFMCSSNGLITHITFWGSWWKDVYNTQLPFQGIRSIHLSLHADIPDPDGSGQEYSKPVVPALWEWEINPQDPDPGWIVPEPFMEEPSWQGWYDPNPDPELVYPDNHTNYFRYEVEIPPEDAFYQTEGTIYWLDISVLTEEGTLWGWKTSRSPHFMDDAVWADLPLEDPRQWGELRDPLEPEISLDLAFIIDGSVEEPPLDLDWGDAPDPSYPTLSASIGANHLIAGGITGALRLGNLIDAESDGQPDAAATGDDLANLDDEDGIVFITPTLYPGAIASVSVTTGFGGSGTTGAAYLQGWVDFNGDGDWNDPGEQVYTDKLLNVPGHFGLPFAVPTNAVGPATTFARFRLSTVMGLAPTGYASDGEVEDYQVAIGEAFPIDWGDAPDSVGLGLLYRTRGSDNGVHHLAVGPFLGALRDAEPDGQPTTAADGDDNNGVDDEDGVSFISPLQPGGYAQVEVVASAAGKLDAWIDFDGSGGWISSEKIFSGQSLGAGTNTLSFAVPLVATNIASSSTYARFRLSTSGVATYVGLATDGEVEDYKIDIAEIEEGGSDWGDAPDPTYPTLSPAGAVHTIVPGIMLGASIDSELDGLPDPAALGDDNANLDDEDGVTFLGKIVVGSNATVNVVAGVSGGWLDAWIDYDQSGSFDGPEHILPTAPYAISPGLNSIGFTVPGPATAKLGPTFARFRIASSPAGLASGGPASDGEVEDYAVELYQSQPSIDIVITNLTFIVSNTVAKVEWTVENDITYQMQATTNLMVSNSWADVEVPVVGPVNWQTNNMSAQSNKFYRVTAPWTE